MSEVTPIEYGTEAHHRAVMARIPAASHSWYPNVAEYPQLAEHLDPPARVSLYKGINAALRDQERRDPRTPCFLRVPGSSTRACGTRAQLEALLAELKRCLPTEYLGAD